MMSKSAFTCRLCGSTSAITRRGHARDDASLVPLECSECGLVQLSSFEHINDTFYRDSHMHDDTPCDEKLVTSVGLEDSARRFQMFAEDIFGKRVLDIGCGDGQFLALAKTIAASAVGCEPDRQWRAHHKKLGLDVVSNLSELEEQASFDVITMFHVLEHIPEPLPFLAGVKERLAGGGGIYRRSPQCKRCAPRLV
jgi:2-polyprenyl-3-methyl-5-hydroxy-6-metoxy-1,4-benzoquinol methylase